MISPPSVQSPTAVMVIGMYSSAFSGSSEGAVASGMTGSGRATKVSALLSAVGSGVAAGSGASVG